MREADRQTDEREVQGDRRSACLLGAVFAGSLSQMDRLRQEEGRSQRASWTRVLVLPSAGCVILSKSLYLSKPLLSHPAKWG